MGAMYNKPANLKYTDLAIYIDANSYKLKNEGEYPEEESTIYEYLYHIVYALACKAGYFRYFSDYDPFACYAAGELYMAMRNKLLNEGKEVRGKKTVPIKSALNFIKATLFPLKINYQKENFSTVVDPALHPNTPVLHTALTEAIQQQYRPAFLDAFNETAKQIPELIREVIYTTPFRNDRLFCKKLYLSITLTLLNDITLPKKVRKKLINSVQKLSSTSGVKHLISTYANNLEPAILWHIDNSFQNYVRILTIKVKKLISKKFNYAIHSDDLSDDLIDSIMQNVYENYDDKGDMD